MSGDWEGNRRSGIALAMRHRLKLFIHLRAQDLSKGDEHPTNTPLGVWYSLPLFLSGVVLFAAPLSAPRDVRIMDVRATNMSVSWLPPDDTSIVGNILGYKVRLLMAYIMVANTK